MFEGTTKRKELHGTTSVHALSGTWANKDDDVILKAYKMIFSCDQAAQKYSSFVLLIDVTLDDDVGNLEIDLYLVDKVVKSSVFPCGEVHLDSDEVQLINYVVLFFIF